METVLNTAAPIFAGVCVLGALLLILRGFLRRGVPQNAYGVERLESRQSMLTSFFGAIIFLSIGVVIFLMYGVFGFDFPVESSEAEPTISIMPTQVPVEATTEPVNTEPTSSPTLAPVVLQTQTSTPEISTETPTVSMTPTPSITPTLQTPTATITPDVDTAVVNSPNGLWLRDAPGGTQEVELIPDQSVLTLLPGRETVDDLEWQQVRTVAGNEGWVAVDFILYQ